MKTRRSRPYEAVAALFGLRKPRRMTGRQPGHDGRGLGLSLMKPSAKRALLLPAWPERKLYWRAAGFSAWGLQPNQGVRTGGVGPVFWPCAARQLVRKACVCVGRAEPDRREWFGPLGETGATVVPRAADYREAARPGWRMGSAAWPTFERRGRAWADAAGVTVAAAGGWVERGALWSGGSLQA